MNNDLGSSRIDYEKYNAKSLSIITNRNNRMDLALNNLKSNLFNWDNPLTYIYSDDLTIQKISSEIGLLISKSEARRKIEIIIIQKIMKMIFSDILLSFKKIRQNEELSKRVFNLVGFYDKNKNWVCGIFENSLGDKSNNGFYNALINLAEIETGIRFYLIKLNHILKMVKEKKLNLQSKPVDINKYLTLTWGYHDNGIDIIMETKNHALFGINSNYPKREYTIIDAKFTSQINEVRQNIEIRVKGNSKERRLYPILKGQSKISKYMMLYLHLDQLVKIDSTIDYDELNYIYNYFFNKNYRNEKLLFELQRRRNKSIDLRSDKSFILTFNPIKRTVNPLDPKYFKNDTLLNESITSNIISPAEILYNRILPNGIVRKNLDGTFTIDHEIFNQYDPNYINGLVKGKIIDLFQDEKNPPHIKDKLLEYIKLDFSFKQKKFNSFTAEMSKIKKFETIKIEFIVLPSKISKLSHKKLLSRNVESILLIHDGSKSLGQLFTEQISDKSITYKKLIETSPGWLEWKIINYKNTRTKFIKWIFSKISFVPKDIINIPTTIIGGYTNHSTLGAATGAPVLKDQGIGMIFTQEFVGIKEILKAYQNDGKAIGVIKPKRNHNSICQYGETCISKTQSINKLNPYHFDVKTGTLDRARFENNVNRRWGGGSLSNLSPVGGVHSTIRRVFDEVSYFYRIDPNSSKISYNMIGYKYDGYQVSKIYGRLRDKIRDFINSKSKTICKPCGGVQSLPKLKFHMTGIISRGPLSIGLKKYTINLIRII